MKKTIPVLFFFLVTLSLRAQKPSADLIETSKGQLTVQPVHHGALILQWDNKTIYVDPYGGASKYKDCPPPDLILITDIHQDHLNTETLDAIESSKAKFIVPQAVADQIPDKYKSNLIILANGKETEQFGININAIPMYNLPETSDSRHTKGRGNGYILKFADKTVYISGDTEDIPEMRNLKNIDLAFVCMNLPFTMDINQAASAVLDFKPAIVYPYHYRGKDNMSDTEAFKKLVNSSNKKIDVRLRNWYWE